MNTATELLREALESLEEWKEERNATCVDVLIEDIRVFLAAEKEADEPTDILTIAYQLGYQEGKKTRPEPETEEPVAWGQPDACGNIVETITPDDKTHTKAPKGWADIYSVPLYTRPEPARKPLPEKIDPILRTAGSMKYHPSYVAGWNNCIDAMSNGAEARKPMTREEIIAGVTHDTSDDFHAGYWAGIRYAEKHHKIALNQSDPDSIDLQSRCRGDKL